MAVGLVDRPEMLMEHAFGRATIDGRDQYDVALVALDVLKIFDEEIFELSAPFLAISLNVGIGRRSLVHQGFYQVALRLVDRDDANRTVKTSAHQLGGLLDNRRRLLPIAPLADLIVPIDPAAGDAEIWVFHDRAGIDQ